jgi:hypothetical protein
MALSDRAVRQAKATGTAYTLDDIDGLSLNVSTHGGKSWYFRYYWLGRQKRLSLGIYPETSFRQARRARDETRTLWAKGSPPKFHRQQEQLTARLTDENTFGIAAPMGWNATSGKSRRGKAVRIPGWYAFSRKISCLSWGGTDPLNQPSLPLPSPQMLCI